jgi:signal transduction histidine kinase
MNTFAIPPLISACLFLAIGFFALFKSESKLKLAYSLLCFLTAAWQISWMALFDVNDIDYTDVIIKVGYSAIIFIPFAYYHFIARFCGIKKPRIGILYGIGILFLAMHLFTPLLIDGHYHYFFGYYPRHGILHPVYLFVLLSLTITTVYYLYSAWKNSDTSKRLNQVRYISVSLGCYGLAATDFLVNYGKGFYPLGVYFIATSLAIMGYAMAKHELLDIRIFVKKTVYYSILLGLLIAPLLPVFYLAENYASPTAKYIIFSIVLIIVGFLFPRIRVGAGRTLNNMLFGEQVDYRKAFSELSQEISHLQPLEELLGKVNDTISWAINVDAVAIYHRDMNSEYFTLKASHGDPEYWQSQFHQTMVNLNQASSELNNYSLYVRSVGHSVTRIPVVFENELIAFILIDNPLSNLGQDEQLVLSTIVNQLAVAINNSQQFESINALNANLEATVEERTQELQKAFDELKQLSHVKSEFFNRVSHELRTPLSNIIMPIEAVMEKMGGHLDEANYQEKKSILRNAAILMKRINEILDIAKLESGKVTLRAQEHNLNTIVEEVISTGTVAAKQMGLEIVFDKAIINPLYLDADKVERVIANIFSNAMKFTESGGCVRFQTAETHEQVTLTISDTGCGIPANELEKIFEPFQQAETNAMHKIAGTGLGLAIAKDFMELHGGSVEVKSKEGQGTTFILTFKRGKDHLLPEQIISDNVIPIVDRRTSERRVSGDRRIPESITWELGEPGEYCDLPVEHATEVNEPDDKLLADRKTILIVEDNHDLSLNMRYILLGQYNVITAENGAIGLEKAEQFKPDIVISDIMMPEMDGITMCAHLRRHPDLIYTPIILLTAKVSVSSRVEGLKTGADYYLEKPFNVKELLTVVKSLLTKKEYQEELLQKNEQLNDAFQQLALANEEIQEANQAKSAFVASLSHELRTPLNAIIGYSEILKEESVEDGLEEYSNDLDKIVASGKHLLSLISTVLDISKIEAGKMTLHLESFGLQSVVNDLRYLAKPLMMVNSNQFTVEIDDELVVMQSDVTKLRQIIMNLISNAAKFTNHGAISLRVRKIITQGRNYARFEVEDNGIGIPPDKIDSLFTDYTQAEASTSKVYGGTGLGLSLSKKLTQLLGGTMSVTSVPEAGSTFSFTIPLTHDEYLENDGQNKARKLSR